MGDLRVMKSNKKYSANNLSGYPDIGEYNSEQGQWQGRKKEKDIIKRNYKERILQLLIACI